MEKREQHSAYPDIGQLYLLMFEHEFFSIDEEKFIVKRGTLATVVDIHEDPTFDDPTGRQVVLLMNGKLCYTYCNKYWGSWRLTWDTVQNE